MSNLIDTLRFNFGVMCLFFFYLTEVSKKVCKNLVKTIIFKYFISHFNSFPWVSGQFRDSPKVNMNILPRIRFSFPASFSFSLSDQG